jgi:hypothetical protein
MVRGALVNGRGERAVDECYKAVLRARDVSARIYPQRGVRR